MLTQPDRPAGRGMKLHPSPVKQFALDHGIAVMQPVSLRPEHKVHGPEAAAAQAALARCFDAPDAPQLMVVAAYGLILPQAVLDLPARGCLNIHASLLPRWRGAAPIHRAIEAGDAETGITIMRMDAGLDTGPMLLTRRQPIAPDMTAGRLHDALAALGGASIVEALAQIDTLVPVPQPAAGVTYANKIDKHEAVLDFALPAQTLVNRVRAFDPMPGSVAMLDTAQGPLALKGWVAQAAAGQGAAGTVLAADAQGVLIACGDGAAIRIAEWQKPGGKRLRAREFLAGLPIAPGARFLPPANAE